MIRTNIFLLELSGQVALDEGGLADTAVTDEDELELGDFLGHGNIWCAVVEFTRVRMRFEVSTGEERIYSAAARGGNMRREWTGGVGRHRLSATTAGCSRENVGVRSFQPLLTVNG
jgi:hypothetical protein